jgi:two-component system cell cycle sensor histidine kinase/response regulator CckA
VESGFQDLIKTGFVKNLECTLLRKDGSTFIGESNAALIRDIDGEPIAAIAITRDITERKMLEERFLRAQKMEAVATLTAGIAHDFNNILTTILGYASFLKSKAKEGDSFHTGLSAIENSTQRASELTSQLLAYSRKGKLEIRPLNLNRVIGEVHDLISKTFHKSIKISLKTDESIKAVDGDESQLNQVVMNIVINAQDAMPNGGTFKIQTYMEDIKSKIEKKYYIIEPGEYVCMKFSDNGIGMDEDTLKRIFEPYFTTKGSMGGTGLGMSVVFGIVKGHGGYIEVKSKLGGGTEITVYLPASKRKEKISKERLEDVIGGSETRGIYCLC